MSSIWFPNSGFGKSLGFVFDSVQEDFEQQAALYGSLDLNYTQLSTGHFRGRIFSALLGSVSIHMEFSNQAIEKEIALPSGEFSFCVTLQETEPIEIYGVAKSGDCVYIIPPKGESVTICPRDCVLLVFTVDHQELLRNAGLMPEVADWLAGLGQGGAIVKSASLARRFRADITCALEGVAKATTPERRSVMDRTTVFSIATALSMDWLKHDRLETLAATNAYERFRRARNALLSDVTAFDSEGARSFDHLGSKRSIEQAFADHVSMGPLAYARVMRLHNVRSKLLDPSRLLDSIGDIAAEEGFWDGGRFAAYYRRQFGELPSVTRERVATRAPAPVR